MEPCIEGKLKVKVAMIFNETITKIRNIYPNFDADSIIYCALEEAWDDGYITRMTGK